MHAPLSLVVPTLNAELLLPATLDCLLEGVWEGMVRELVVLDRGSQDGTFAIADAAGASWIDGSQASEPVLVHAVATTRAPWLLIVPQDLRLARGWSAAVLQALSVPDVAHQVGEAGLRGAMAAWRLRALRRPDPAAGLLVHRHRAERVHGGPWRMLDASASRA